jgi:hypothetical protein
MKYPHELSGSLANKQGFHRVLVVQEQEQLLVAELHPVVQGEGALEVLRACFELFLIGGCLFTRRREGVSQYEQQEDHKQDPTTEDNP